MGIYNFIKNNKINLMKSAVSIKMDNGSLREYTYAELFEKCDQYADEMRSYGITSGDRIIIIAENSPEWNIAYLAIMKMRCTAVLIDSSLTENEIKNLVEKSDGRLILTSTKIIKKSSAIFSDKVPVLNILDECRQVYGSVSCIDKNIGETCDKDENVAVIIYSSGTTKSASGIMHTHEAMIGTIKMTVKENDLKESERIFSVLPNTHIYGVITGLLGAMSLGASLYYIESMTNENVINGFKEFKPTVFPCVPKVFELFEKQIVKKIYSNKGTQLMYKLMMPFCIYLRKKTNLKLGKIIFSSIHKGFGGHIRLMTCAGAPLDEKTAEFYYGTGFNMLITYGLTETNIPVIGNRGNNITNNSCGKPYPMIQIKIAKKDDKGEGELYIKSPFMMKSYFRDEHANKEAFEDGYFKTGDLCILDENENIKIVGRAKENIVLSTGKKVTPSDIECKYSNISGVKEFVVAGIPCANGSYDEVHGFVVKESKDIDDNEIIRSIKNIGSSLSLYMKITKVHFIDEVPKTSLQKPKRYLLKKYVLEENKGKKETLPKETHNKNNIMNNRNTINNLKNIIAEICNIDSDIINDNSKIFLELGMDSLGAIEFSSIIEEKYKVDVSTLYNENITISEICENIENPTKMVSSFEKVYLRKKHDFHYRLFKVNTILANLLYKVKVKNSDNIPKDTGYIICANHVTNIDYLWLTMKFKKEEFKKFCCMAKKELFGKSFINKILIDVCGMIPVDRGGINSETIKCSIGHLKEQYGLLIHPEGTRSKDGKLGKLKKGAATISKEANVPIIPAYIKGAFDIYPAGRKIPKLFDWKNMRRYEIEIIYGNPIYPSELDADEIINMVERSLVSMT